MHNSCIIMMKEFCSSLRAFPACSASEPHFVNRVCSVYYFAFTAKVFVVLTKKNISVANLCCEHLALNK